MTQGDATLEADGGAGKGRGGVGAGGAARSGVPWHPPVALWQLFLLILLTIGFYIPFWGMRLAQDMRRHKDQSVIPWQYFVGWLIGIAAPFVAYRQAGQIRLLRVTAGQRLGPDPWFVAILVALAEVAGFLLNRIEEHEWTHLTFGLLYAYAAIISIPILVLQRQLNRYKLSLGEGQCWTGRPFRFTKLQYAALGLGLIVVAGIAFLGYDSIVRSRGAGLEAGRTVNGASGLYTLTVPSEDWVRVATGTIEEATDLELYGPTAETWAVVYVDRANELAMDDLVDFRRTAFQENFMEISVSEERIMLPGSFVPVSYARYSGREQLFGAEAIWWVGTVVTDDFSIEAIACTVHGGSETLAVERLVKSLRLVGAGETE